MTKVGDVVTDGSGTRGRVMKIEHVPVFDVLDRQQRTDERIYVDWSVGDPVRESER